MIGRGGETIRALQQASGAHIAVDQDVPPTAPRLVYVRGTPDAVWRAAAMVACLASDEAATTQSVIAQFAAGVKCEVAVPRAMVGRVIGRGGDTVKLLQRAYGVNIQIDQVRGGGSVVVVGGREGWWECGGREGWLG